MAQDTGTAKYDTYTWKSGEDLAHAAIDLFNRNPGRWRNENEALAELINFNNSLAGQNLPGWQLIKNEKGGIRCDGVNIKSDWRVNAGKTLYYPEVENEIQDARDITCLVRVPEVPDVPVKPPVQSEIEPLAQFSPAPVGMVEYGLAMSRAQYFLGEPPRDVAAENSERTGRKRNGRIEGNTSEGTKVKDEEGRLIVMRRAGRSDGSLGELLYAPELTYYIDQNGKAIVPNTKYEQKLEENARQMFDENGQPIFVVDGNALISINRRMNPYYAGIFKDEHTAANRITEFSNSTQGLDAIVSYTGLERAYGKTAARYEQTKSAEDARYLLELNVQTALNPLVWSVSNQGVPVIETTVIQNEMTRILKDHPELQAEFGKYVPLISRPTALDKATGGVAGRRHYTNYMDDWAGERAQLNFIEKAFKQKDNGSYKRTDGQPLNVPELSAANVGAIFADTIRDRGSRAPTEYEQLLGSGVAINRDRQAPDALAAAETDFVRKFASDKEFATAVLKHAANTPGGLQKLNDLLFYAGRDQTDNQRLIGFDKDTSGIGSFLGFTNNGDAEDFSTDIATRVTGDKNLAEKMQFRDPGVVEDIFTGIVRTATGGLVTLGKSANQNRGLFDAEPVIKNRLNGFSGPEATDETVAGYQALAAKVLEGKDKGVEETQVAIHNFALAANPQAYQLQYKLFEIDDARRNDGKSNAVWYKSGMDGKGGYDAVARLAGADMMNTLSDAQTVNWNYAGNTNGIANIEIATEAKVANGANIRGNATEAEIRAAIAGSSVGNGTTPVAASNGASTRAAITTVKAGKIDSKAEAVAYSVNLLKAADADPAFRAQLEKVIAAYRDNKVQGKNTPSSEAYYVRALEAQLGSGGDAKAKAAFETFFASATNQRLRSAETVHGTIDAWTAAANATANAGISADTVSGGSVTATNGKASTKAGAGESTMVTIKGGAPIALSALNLDAITAAAKSGNPAAVTQALVTANNANGATQAQMDAAVVADIAKDNPAMFSLLVAQSALAGQDAYDSFHATIEDLDDKPGRNVSRYADLLNTQISAINAARKAAREQGKPELVDEATTQALSAFTAFFADGKNDTADRQSVAELVSLMNDDKSGFTNATFAGQYTQLTAGDRSQFLSSLVSNGALSQADLTSLLSLGAITDESVRTGKFNDWLAGHQAELQSFTAHTGVSYVEIIKLILITTVKPPGKHDTPVTPGDLGNCEDVKQCPIPGTLPDLPFGPDV